MKLIPRQQTTPQPLRQPSPPSVGIGYIQVYLPWAPPLPQGMTEESLSPPSYFFRLIPPFPTQQRQTAPRRPTLPAAPPKRPTAAMKPPRRPSLPEADVATIGGGHHHNGHEEGQEASTLVEEGLGSTGGIGNFPHSSSIGSTTTTPDISPSCTSLILGILYSKTYL